MQSRHDAIDTFIDGLTRDELNVVCAKAGMNRVSEQSYLKCVDYMKQLHPDDAEQAIAELKQHRSFVEISGFDSFLGFKH